MKCPTCGKADLDHQGECPVCQYFDRGRTAHDSDPAALDLDLNKALAAIERAPTAEARTTALEKFEQDVLRLHRSRYGVITLIGFSTTGKTFFANRVRRQLRLDGWNVRPDEQETILKTQAKIDYTQLVQRSRLPRKRVIADCDGEAYRSAVHAIRDDKDAMARHCLLITAAASAYVLILPADLRADADANLAERFHVIINAILAVQHRLRTASIERLLEEGFNSELISQSLETSFWCDRPLLVLFTQADRFPHLDGHTQDPLVYAMTHATPLFRTVAHRFKQYRFDFVSAFAGHDVDAVSQGRAGAVNYSLAHSGVVEAFDWLDRNIRAPRLWRGATPSALIVRRLLDPRFRSIYRKVMS